MNLQKLFELQRQLDEHIEKEHPRQEGEDRLAKKILALFVELGELANEHRGFKYWSNDQEPRTGGECSCDDGYIDVYMGHGVVEQDICPRCEGMGELPNTLLEEYVDCLHFILSIGLELDFTDIDVWKVKEATTTNQFIECFGTIYNMHFQKRVNGEVPREMYEHLFACFIGLGEMLGFTWEQIEESYFEKNRINHERQNNGY
ncbi:dUTP diphosphatase [Geobacillus thermodenitrificans]|uniref:dUTP diphosphatase n=1 Tax=Geobacillus thermodenitrificans TaxID=33940 RepID=UPI0035B4FDCC